MLSRTSGHFGGNQYTPARFRTVDRYAFTKSEVAAPFVEGRALPPPRGLRPTPIHCYAIFNRKLIFGLK